MKIEEALDRFLVQLCADGRAWNTRRQYERHCRLLARCFREHEVEEIGHEDVARFFTSRTVTHLPDRSAKKASTVNALRSSVRCFFKYARGAGYTSTDASRLLRRARTGTPPPRCLSAEEEGRFFEVLDAGKGWEAERDRVLFRLMRASGIRLGSALGLEARDVDLDRGELVLRCTKGDRPERVILSRAAIDLLRGWMARRAGPGPLFPTRQGSAISGRQVQRRFAQWRKSAGNARAISPHALRHTFATLLYRQTGDLLLVKEALRHRSIASTLVYAAADTARLRSFIRGGEAEAPDRSIQCQ